MPAKIKHPRSGELKFHWDPVQQLFVMKGSFRDALGVEQKLGHANMRDWGALIEAARLLMQQASHDDWLSMQEPTSPAKLAVAKGRPANA